MNSSKLCKACGQRVRRGRQVAVKRQGYVRQDAKPPIPWREIGNWRERWRQELGR